MLEHCLLSFSHRPFGTLSNAATVSSGLMGAWCVRLMPAACDRIGSHAVRFTASVGRGGPLKRPTLAPDGTYVDGTPRLCPDGTYVGDGGPITLAPNGKYVAGRPRIAPNGQYVGGTDSVMIAPDGTYVAGPARICPNGRYI